MLFFFGGEAFTFMSVCLRVWDVVKANVEGGTYLLYFLTQHSNIWVHSVLYGSEGSESSVEAHGAFEGGVRVLFTKWSGKRFA